MKKSNWLKFKKSWVTLSLLLTLFLVAAVQADVTPKVPVPDGPTSERLGLPIALDHSPRIAAKVDGSLAGETGKQIVVVRMTEASIGETIGEINKGKSSNVRADEVLASSADAKAAKSSSQSQQAAVKAQIFAADPTANIIAETHILLNAIFVEIDAAAIPQLAELNDVVSINQVKNYTLDLNETVPYIGATAVQDHGYDGSGITVAVLDSGVDYTHANLGGGGTLEDYEAAWGSDFDDVRNTSRDGLFPTGKVVEGYDFVGESWGRDASGAITGSLEFDDDPIDFEGHGTHVADIIAGANGVAPGADIVAVKVCSAVSSACSGVSLILGMEFAVAQGVDIINLSLGSDYGTPFDDDLTAALEAASALGVLSVSSAGNGGDNQYKVGTPSTAPNALSVAQTAVPSALLDVMSVEGGSDHVAIRQDWSAELDGAVTAPAQYGDLDGTNLNGCAPFTGDLSGHIVLVDRGACTFSAKIQNIEAANGVVGVIGLVAPGEPFGGGFGGGDEPGIPGFMVDLTAADDFRAAAAAGLTVSFDPENALSLAGTVVSSSSRGPSNDTNLIKPEIGAPGASISAQAGTGTGETPFGGTSGASPMVAGAAALLMDAYDVNSYRWIRPDQIKAMLMNNGETEIYTSSPAAPGAKLAPITRIGGGEVRVDRALDSEIVAYSADFTGTGALSFKHVDVYKKKVYNQRFVIDNLSSREKTINLTPIFRDAEKEATGAVSVRVPDSITIPGYQARVVTVRISVDPTVLPPWVMNIGGLGSGAAALDFNEFDGYIMLDDQSTSADDADPAHMAWHILPRASGRAVVERTNMPASSEFLGLPAGITSIANDGLAATQVSAFAYMGGSPDLPPAIPGTQSPIADIKHSGYRAFLADPSLCTAGWGMEFAIAAWERQTHEWPNYYSVYLDTNNNGVIDRIVYNYDLFLLTGSLDGRNVTYVDSFDDETGEYVGTSAFFFTTSPTNYNNYILTVCGEQLGFEDTSAAGAPMLAAVTGSDGYYTGAITDIAGEYVISPFGNRYAGILVADDGTISSNLVIPAGGANDLVVVDLGPEAAGTDEGVMLVYLDGAPNGHENDIVTVWTPEGENVSCQLLTNGDFDTDLSGWDVHGSLSQSDDAFAGSGAIAITDGWTGQVVSAAADGEYNLSGYYKATGNAAWVGMGIDFLDANGAEVGESLHQVSTNGEYASFSIDGTAPAGTTQIQVWFYSSSGGVLQVDDVVLSDSSCGG